MADAAIEKPTASLDLAPLGTINNVKWAIRM
jgi:hypothetical protein